MATERYNMIIGMEYQPGNSVQQALRSAADMRSVIERELSKPMTTGPIVMADMSSAVQRLREQISQVQIASQFPDPSGVRGKVMDQLRNIDSRPSSPQFTADLRRVAADATLTLARMKATGDDTVKAQIPLVQAIRAEATALAGLSAAEQARLKPTLALAAALGKDLNRQLADDAKQAAADESRREATLKLAQRLGKATNVAIAKQNAADEQLLQRTLQRAQSLGKATNVAIAKNAARDQAVVDANLTAAARLGKQINVELAKQAAIKARQNVADEASMNFRPSFPGADAQTSLGRAQMRVNNAERTLEIATRSLAEERVRDGRTLTSVQQAQNRLETATSQLAVAQRLAARAAITSSSSPRAPFSQQFALGFKGEADKPYGEQLGQAFKFSLFYGTAYKLLFALTATFQQTLQEGIEFQKAVTDLKLAAGRTGDEIDSLANTLGARSTEAGFAPSQGVQVGARSLGLYGVTASDAETQARVAEISARVVSRIAASSGQQPEDLQTNIAAIAQAFGGGAESQFRTYDLDAYMAKRFGVGAGETIGAVSEAGTVGRAAGFTLEEVSAIAADIMSRTGQTQSATAGYMAQIFSRGGEGTLTAVTQRYGIDQEADLATQMKELAQIYKTASDSEKTAIASSFGRGKVQNAAIALLQDFDEVMSAADAARSGAATGKGDEAFKLRMADIGGQIQLTVATLKEFANQLGQSGVLHMLGAAMVVIRDLVGAATELLKVWNTLPGAVKAAAASLLVLAAAGKAGAFGGIAAGFGARAGMSIGQAVPFTGRVIQTASGPIPLASRAGAGAALSGLATGAAPAIAVTAAIAGLYAVGKLKSTSDALAKAQTSATKALAKSGPLVTSDDFLNRAAYLRAQAADSRETADSLFAPIIGLGRGKDRALADAERLEAEARLAARVGRRQAAREEAEEPFRPLITGFDPTSLTESFDAISTGGGTAKDQLDALRDALYGTADAARQATKDFDPQTFADENYQGVFEAIQSGPQTRITRSSPGWKDIAQGVLAQGTSFITHQTPNDPFDRKYKDITNGLIQQVMSGPETKKRLQDSLEGITSLADIDEATAKRIATDVVGDSADVLGKEAGKGGILDKAGVEAAREDMVANVEEYLLARSVDVAEMLAGDNNLTQAQLAGVIDHQRTATQALLESLPESDLKGRRQALAADVRVIREAIRQSAGGVDRSAAQGQLAEAQRALAEAQFQDLENMRRVAQHNAKTKAEVAAIGRRFLGKEIRGAVNNRAADVLAKIIGQAGDGSIRMAKAAITDAIIAAEAALEMRQRLAAAVSGLIPMVGGVLALAQLGQSAEVERLKDWRKQVNNILAGGKENDVYTSGSDANLPSELTDKAEEGPTAAEIAAARAAAAAARSESPIDAARASIMSARAAMAKAEKGTIEYYQALASFYEARSALTDAILDYRNNLDLLNIDITDPVAQANAAVRAAARKLRSDRGKGADVLAADRVALREAQASREATAFDTRLSNVQTAEQLGRISHAQYIRYLENESKRLNRIKDRTYQQQQQLNQIDGLLQEASEQMAGQWNFGNIKLPTPYQVRRYIAANDPAEVMSSVRSQGGIPQDRGPASVENKVYINGADVAKVRRVVEDVIGRANRTTTTAPRRRV